MTLPKKWLYGVKETCDATGLRRTAVFGLMRDGKLKRVKVGRRTLVTAESIEAFVAELARETAS